MMDKTPIEAFRNGNRLAKSRLLCELRKLWHMDTTPHVSRWKFASRSGEIKTQLLRQLASPPDNEMAAFPTDWHMTPFLNDVRDAFHEHKADFESDESITFYVRDRLPSIREKHKKSGVNSELSANGAYQESTGWSDTLLANWLGAYSYLASSAQQDINDFVTQVKGPLTVSEPLAASEPSLIAEQESERRGEASAKQAVALLMTLLHESVSEGANYLTEDAFVRLAHFLTGRTPGNIDRELKLWKKNELKDYRGNLVQVLKLLEDLNLDMKLTDLRMAIDKGQQKKIVKK